MVEPASMATGAPPSACAGSIAKLAHPRGGAKNGLCASRRTQRARLALGGSSTTLGDGSAPSAPLQKVSADPYFNRTRFPPPFPLLRTRRSGAVLGSRDSVSAARVPLSGTDRRFPALCKKCRQTPILTLTSFPPHSPRRYRTWRYPPESRRSASVLRRGGGRLHRRREAKRSGHGPSAERARSDPAVDLVMRASRGALVAWVVRVRG